MLKIFGIVNVMFAVDFFFQWTWSDGAADWALPWALTGYGPIGVTPPGCRCAYCWRCSRRWLSKITSTNGSGTIEYTTSSPTPTPIRTTPFAGSSSRTWAGWWCANTRTCPAKARRSTCGTWKPIRWSCGKKSKNLQMSQKIFFTVFANDCFNTDAYQKKK